jgi:DnaJ-class molecular chaperone
MVISRKSEQELFKCPTCDGDGEVHSHNPKCPSCHGRGKLPKARADEVRGMEERVRNAFRAHTWDYQL